MVSMKRRWKDSEIDFLKKNYKVLTPKKCAESLNRTSHSVKQKAKQLDLVSERVSFSQPEIDYVKAHYLEKGPIVVAKELNRKRHSVYELANRQLGLKMTPEAIGRMQTRLQMGRKHSEATKKKIGDSHRGPIIRKYCLDCHKKISKNAIRCQVCNLKTRAGKEHMWWNGGVSSFYQLTVNKLYPAWKYPILCRDGFRCQYCGEHEHLEVHHLRLFVGIRDQVIKDNPQFSLDIKEDQLKIANLIIAEHRMEDGITLCYSCHKACHFEKRDELLEPLTASGEDNQQPSRSNVVSIVDRKVQRAMGEDTTNR